MPRLFVAVEVAEEPRAALAALCEAIPGVRWVTAAQMHVTIRFLGEVAPKEVDRVRAALATVPMTPFSIALSGVGVFPPPATRKPPRILWAGVSPAAPLQDLKAAIDLALGPDPEARRRAFSPHITLARLGHRAGLPLVHFLEAHRNLASLPWSVEAFHLYESQTLSEGAVYAILRTYR
jgi:RNA 2',3'-cyclic 3'-phosphodiesterase